MIYLNQDDIVELVDYAIMMDQIEEAYRLYDEKTFAMPDRWHVENGGLTSLYMPCFLEDLYGTKVLSVLPANINAGRPVIDGVMLLNDAKTGEILALMDGKILTALRTGAVGGVGIRHLSRSDSSTVGIVGAGVQGYYQAIFACTARSIKQVNLYDISESRVYALRDRLSESLGGEIEVKVADSSEQLVAASDIIITATTANEPVLPDAPDLLRGKHYVGIGSYKPTMREYPDSFFGLIDKVYIDQDFAKEESGDLSVPVSEGILKEEQIECFSSYLYHEEQKDNVISSTTFFKSVGMALFDVVTARYIHAEAKKRGAGLNLPN